MSVPFTGQDQQCCLHAGGWEDIWNTLLGHCLALGLSECRRQNLWPGLCWYCKITSTPGVSLSQWPWGLSLVTLFRSFPPSLRGASGILRSPVWIICQTRPPGCYLGMWLQPWGGRTAPQCVCFVKNILNVMGWGQWRGWDKPPIPFLKLPSKSESISVWTGGQRGD